MKRIQWVIFGISVLVGFAIFFFAYRANKAQQERFAALPEVSFFGFIRSAGSGTLNIDEVQFLSGDEARRYAEEDTTCSAKNAEDCIPSLNNDFYIRNIETSTKAYSIAEDASITILTNPGSPMLGSSTREEFLRVYPKKDFNQPFRFTAKGTMLVSLEEQYTP